ncbi:S-adenosyl-L-methionine dependent methyltransferase [Lentinus tigrinus ALCF2SS1-7]|uniref:S-adenosyl-L-methionine dependent methyltransferase n=1 Tax=Lentinus tigrinus ALCF2SS1-6 TaxID=1328759 RepID=A0A5C2RPU2_9APHY|nr:S-adenosyl-L-methionine dependent methyltransferase [Lentinus tigrinus ALCF2SS1-6]RPD68204.1 S-adenosyl-L-methionine dependent methyltransferase [Lentinus tigrinus ALCF2SS1-7]
MHTRNPYQHPLDFLALAQAYPALKTHLIHTLHGAAIDFKNETAQRRLTEAILHRDFGLRLDLPSGRLCPPVPNRLNYILWLEDVLEAVALAEPSNDPARGHVRVFDIGTGASAIYPLLGCSTHPNWKFTATEVDPLSIRYARQNVSQNGLEERIHIVQADPDGGILAPLERSDVTYDFTMCNPPFYASREEVIQSAEAKEFEPNAVCTGADTEMITPGGEANFVGRMVQESVQLRDRCRWFTSMLGKMSSLTHIVHILREHAVTNYAITELVQGQTRRWAIAWSYCDVHLPDPIGRLSHHALQSILPPRNTLVQPLQQAASPAQVVPILTSVLASVDGLTVRQKSPESGAADVIATAYGNTWSRAARRKKRDAMPVEMDSRAQSEVQLVCRTRLGSNLGEESAVTLVFDWVAGKDRGLFESFASHVERKVVGALVLM